MRNLTLTVLACFSLQVTAAEYKLTVLSGEKITAFTFENAVGKAALMRMDAKGRKSLPLNAQNTEFLNKRFQELAKFKSQDATLCHGQMVVLAVPGKKRVYACAGSPQDISKRMVGLANLLQLRTNLM